MRNNNNNNTHATVTGSSKVSYASRYDKSFLFQKHSQPSTALPYFDITTYRSAQSQARSDRRNAEGDAGRERERLRQAAARAARRYPVTPAGLTCCDESSLQPTYCTCTHTHTHTHAHTQQATPPALLPSSQTHKLFIAFKWVPQCRVVTLGQQYNVGERTTVILYTSYIINRYARPSDTRKAKDNTVRN